MEGAVRSTIGNAYLELGLYREGAEQLTGAAYLLERGGAPFEDVIFARNRAIWADAMSGKWVFREADGAFRNSEARLGREHPETVYAADSLAQVMPQRTRAMTLLRDNLEIQRRRLGTDHQLALRAASQLVIALSKSQTDADLDEAESLARESCEQWVRRYGPGFPETLFALAQRGEILATRGKLEEAKSVLAPLPDAMARTLGPDHFQRGTMLRNYGLVLEALGDLDGAMAQYRQSLAIISKRLAGRKDSDQLEALLHACLARVEMSRGRAADVVTSLLPILRTHAKKQTLSVPDDRVAGTLAERAGRAGRPDGRHRAFEGGAQRLCPHGRTTRLALASSPEPDRRRPAPPGNQGQGDHEPAVRRRADGEVPPQAPRARAGRGPGAARPARRGEKRGQGRISAIGALTLPGRSARVAQQFVDSRSRCGDSAVRTSSAAVVTLRVSPAWPLRAPRQNW